MSTNKQSSRNRGCTVTAPPEVKRRRLLENLLSTRNWVARMESEFRSHGLDEHLEMHLLQLEIEQVLADEFPAVYEGLIGDWVEAEVAAAHHPAPSAETCTLCRAIAQQGDESGAPVAA